ncbi:MAG: lipopolysaccharide biosynthesis protein [Acidobacteriota bacterium]|jgi:PST family polysaccharide transporter
MNADRNASFRRKATGLGPRAAAAGGVTGVAELLKVAVQTLALAALARVLTPDDFGVVAMVSAVIGLVALSDLGLPAATVQRGDLTHDEASSLFWINVAAGLAAGVLTVALAPAISWLYGEPRLTAISAALASLFILQGFGAQPLAILQRQLRFTTVAAINVSALLAAAVAAVAAALAGAGYWALVVQQVAAAAWTSCAAWMSAGWRPSSPRNRVRVGHLLAFGGNLTAARSALFLSRNVSRLIIGIVTGAAALGGYTNAYNLSLRPLARLGNPFVPVASSVLSRVTSEPERFRAFYRRGSLAFNSLSLPIFALLALDAPDVVALVLGGRWMDITPVFRWLALAAAVQSLFTSIQWIYLSSGQGREQLRWSMVRAVVTIGAVAVGSRHGVLGAATGVALASFLLLPVGIAMVARVSPVHTSDFVAASWRPVAATALAVLAVFGLAHLLAVGSGPAVRLLLDVAVFAVVYAATWSALYRGTPYSM